MKIVPNFRVSILGFTPSRPRVSPPVRPRVSPPHENGRASARRRRNSPPPVPAAFEAIIVRGAVAWTTAGALAGLSRLPAGLILRAKSGAQAKTAMQAGSEDLARVVVECEFDDWAGRAKSALVMADSARGFRGRRSRAKSQRRPLSLGGSGAAGNLSKNWSVDVISSTLEATVLLLKPKRRTVNAQNSRSIFGNCRFHEYRRFRGGQSNQGQRQAGCFGRRADRYDEGFR